MVVRQVVDRWLERTLVVLMAVMVLDVVWQVASRYVFSSPSSFTDELAAFLLIWVGILGGGYVYGKGEHLAIDILVSKSSPSNQRRLREVIQVVVFLFALMVMIVGGVQLVFTRFVLDVKSAALQINWGYVYMVIPVCGALICYYCVDNLLNLKREK